MTALPGLGGAAPADTVPVTYRLCGIERVRGAGRLLAVAICEIEVAGVVLTLQGVQVRRRADGGVECAAPVWRHPGSGRWLPAVILPPELQAALAADVLAGAGDAV